MSSSPIAAGCGSLQPARPLPFLPAKPSLVAPSMDSRTFSLDVSSPGAASLRRAVLLKLSEFMGNYTDDVLAEYVVVLVGHGKQRAQAVKDLEAFLGEWSEAFVIWLWDHLCSNMHLYSSAPEASSPMEDFDGREQAVQERSNEAVKIIEAKEQSQVKNRVQVSSVTHEHGRTARLRKDSDQDVDSKSRKDPHMVASFSGREKTMLYSGDFENLRTAAKEFNGGRTATHSAKRPRSPESWIPRERNVTDERHHKRLLSPPRVNATRRLLQSAVREAVAPATGHSKRLESSLKRLRSVVSADVENSESIADASSQQPLKATARSHAVRQSKMAVPAMVVAMKAAAAAAEDAIKVRGRLIGNVWDRLGKHSAEVVDNKEEVVHEHVEDGHEDREALDSRFVGASQHSSGKKARKRARLGSSDRPSKGSTGDEAAAVLDPTIDEYREGQSSSGRSVYTVRGGKRQTDEVNDDSFSRAHNHTKGQRSRAKDRLDQSQGESVTVQYRLAQNMEGDAKEQHKQKGLNSSSGLANSSQKIVNISVNVNTWKPRPYETLKDTTASEQPIMASTSRKSQDQVDKAEDTDMLGVHDTIEPKEESDSDTHVTDMKNRTGQVQLEMNKMLARQTEVTKEVQKDTSPTVTGTKQFQKSQDDTETRTVFVANIHFAATKETVMAHFVQCGDIERIVMLTDGATGLPKGSAYIEFNSKDSVEKALALNESSFYSRPLKVVRKEAAIQAIQETTPLLVRPTFIRRPIPLSLRVPFRGRLLRGSPYLVRRFPSMPRPYGNFPNLQWKRDGVTASGSMNPTALSGNRPGYGLPIRPARSLSYVRSSNNPPAQNTAITDESKVISQQGENDGMKPDVAMCPTQEQKGDMETRQVEVEQVVAGD